MHLALDHLTVTDAYPWQIAELAAVNGLQGCCLFLESMSVLPLMPDYSLIKDQDARLRTHNALKTHGISLDLAYPFTLSGRSRIEDFMPALETAAYLDAQAVNLLVYDREQDRREANVAAFADTAAQFGLDVVVEFYPPSAIGSLKQADDLVSRVNRANLGINADLLHLYRSGGSVAEIAEHGHHIRFAQLADAPLSAPVDTVREAGSERMGVGEGQLPVEAFLKALPNVKISLEVPNEIEILSGRDQAVRTAISIALFKSAARSLA